MKRILFIFISSFLFLSGSAQQSHNQPENLKYRNNWFVQGQLGMAYTLSEYYSKASFSDIIAPHFSVAIGKHTSPIMSARLQLEGWQSKNFYLQDNNPHTYSIKYFQINIDRQFNLTTLIKRELSDYSPFYLTANIGLGYAHGFKNSQMQTKSTNMIVPRLGISGNWQLNSLITLNLEMTANFYPDRFNGNVYGKKYDGIINTMVGIKYNLIGKQKKQNTPPTSLDNTLTQEQVDAIYTIMKKQEYEDSITSNEIKAPTQSKILMNAIVQFDKDSVIVNGVGENRVDIAAQYLQQNPEIDMTITGHTDDNAESRKLAELRIQNIREILITKYYINPNRLSVNTINNQAKVNTVVFYVFKSAID